MYCILHFILLYLKDLGPVICEKCGLVLYYVKIFIAHLAIAVDVQ